MKTTRLIRSTALGFAIVSFVALIFVNDHIAARYNQADGKTRALFGIVELLEFQYKYLILIPAALALLFTIRLIWKKEFKPADTITLAMTLCSIVGTITSSWKLII